MRKVVPQAGTKQKQTWAGTAHYREKLHKNPEFYYIKIVKSVVIPNKNSTFATQLTHTRFLNIRTIQNVTKETQLSMNRIILVLVFTLLAFASCNTTEKVVYFQDVAIQDQIRTQALKALTFEPGDKLTIIVSSSKTPELAVAYNLPIITLQTGSTSKSTSNQIAVYTVDENGDVDVPSLGKVKVAGLTRSQVADVVTQKLRDGQYIKDAVVTVNAYEQYVTILGEVKQPGKYEFKKDNMTLLEAIGAAGDLNIQARRDCILVLRQEGEVTKSYYVDIRSKDLLDSPVYNLKQNDVIYVTPNKVRAGQSTVNDNSVRSISTWLSISSFLLSLAILIFN